jgi:hypothetical protein
MARGFAALGATVLLASLGPALAVAQDGGSDMDDHDERPTSSKYPDLRRATKHERAQARRLRRQTEKETVRYRHWARAIAAGYVRWPRFTNRPYLFHARIDGKRPTNSVPVPERPSALMYWWPKHGRAVLVGVMYRVPRGQPPDLGGGILSWHHHHGRSQMTHVWLTGKTRTAYARCMPVFALQAAILRFRWSKPTHPGSHHVHPCERPRRREPT